MIGLGIVAAICMVVIGLMLFIGSEMDKVDRR